MYNKIRWCCIRHDKPRNGNQLINTDYFEKKKENPDGIITNLEERDG